MFTAPGAHGCSRKLEPDGKKNAQKLYPQTVARKTKRKTYAYTIYIQSWKKKVTLLKFNSSI